MHLLRLKCNRRSTFRMIGVGSWMFADLRTSGAAVSQDDLLQVLDNALWIPDGAHDAKRQAYILAAPWCPYCRTLYQKSRGFGDAVQLRWIEAGEIDIRSARYIQQAGLYRDVRLLTQMYESAGTASPAGISDPFLAENISRYAFGVRCHIGLSSQSGSQTSTGYPTVIFETEEGLFVRSGTPKNFSEFVTSLRPRSKPTAKPLGVDLVRMKYALESTASTPRRPRSSGSVPIYSLPHPASPVIAFCRRGEDILATGRTSVGDMEWLELRPFTGRGTYTGFGRARDFAG